MTFAKKMWKSKAQWITHRDVRAEYDSLGLPEHWSQETDSKLSDKYFKRFTKRRSRVFRRHLATLSRTERSTLKAGKHPSQSHELAEDALRYADDLLMELRGRGIDFVEDIRLGYYHCDRLLLTMVVSDGTSDVEAEAALPFYFRGFETRWSRHKKANKSE